MPCCNWSNDPLILMQTDDTNSLQNVSRIHGNTWLGIAGKDFEHRNWLAKSVRNPQSITVLQLPVIWCLNQQWGTWVWYNQKQWKGSFENLNSSFKLHNISWMTLCNDSKSVKPLKNKNIIPFYIRDKQAGLRA